MVQTSSLLAPNPTDLPEALRSAIEDGRAEADVQRRLPAELAETLRRAGAFRLSTPTEYAGHELPLSSTLDLYEAYGRIDGPVAWNIWNGGLGFAAAILSEEGADLVWGGSDPIVANSARPAGIGNPVAGGYELTGRWDIVSAIDIADWVALFAIANHSEPEVRVMFLPRGDFTIVDTWHTSGMRGTGSKTVVVDGAFVPDALAVSPFTRARIDRPLYRIPAFTLGSTGAAPIVIGIAQAAIDEVVEMAPTKATDNGQVLAQRPHAHASLGASQTSLDAARALLRSAVADIERAAAEEAPVTERQRAHLRAAMSHAARVSREVLATCQQLASSTAIYTDNTIERLVRDGNVALQHFILSPTHSDILGRLMVGEEAGTPVV